MFFGNIFHGFQLKHNLMNNLDFFGDSQISLFMATLSTINRNWLSIFRWGYLVSIISFVCSTLTYLFTMVRGMLLPKHHVTLVRIIDFFSPFIEHLSYNHSFVGQLFQRLVLKTICINRLIWVLIPKIL